MFQLENVLGIIVTDRDGIVKSISCSNGNFDSSLIGVKWYNALKIPKEEYYKIEDKCPKIFSLPEERQKISVSPSCGESGVISGFHILIEKIEDEKDSTQYLNKMLCFGEIVPGIAHEICNPLTYVSGWLQMFLAEARDNDPRKKTYEALIREFERGRTSPMTPFSLSVYNIPSAYVSEPLPTPLSIYFFSPVCQSRHTHNLLLRNVLLPWRFPLSSITPPW